MIDCKSMTHGTLSAIYIPFPSKGIPKLKGASEFAFPFKVPFHVEILKGVTNCEMAIECPCYTNCFNCIFCRWQTFCTLYLKHPEKPIKIWLGTLESSESKYPISVFLTSGWWLASSGGICCGSVHNWLVSGCSQCP